MTRVVIDRGVIFKLNELREALELCDESGRLLGYFTPAADPCERFEPPITEEELRRIENDPRSYTTVEVLAHLKGL
ncbi:MAG: hypothetical protein EXS05_04645 [Planctomycetaceae bacterium]|nr:hypothetical protein [Planctomycetaceae bacterium]